MENTRSNHHMTLVLALNYSGRWEILNAIKAMSQDPSQNLSAIDEETFASFLTITQGLTHWQAFLALSMAANLKGRSPISRGSGPWASILPGPALLVLVLEGEPDLCPEERDLAIVHGHVGDILVCREGP